MTQEFRIWKPEHDGHAPPNWREGMIYGAFFSTQVTPGWSAELEYVVPAEALNSPNDDASGDVDTWAESDAKRILRLVESLRAYPAETLLKHGITLAPEKDWAMELWADIWEARGLSEDANLVRKGVMSAADRVAIELLRTRFEQMIAERRKRDV